MERVRRIAALLVAAVFVTGSFGLAPTTVLAVTFPYFSCATGSGHLRSDAPEKTVSQGQTAVFTVVIDRLDCPEALTFADAVGSPLTAPNATISPNPTTADRVTVTIPTSNVGAVTAPGTYGYFLRFTGGHAYPDDYFQVLLHVTASIAPVEKPPISGFATNSTIGSTTVPVRTSWSATDPDGIARYALQRQVNGGAWATVALATPTTAAISQSLTFGATYRYRVKATDKKGHASPLVYGKPFMPRIYQQNSSLVTSDFLWTTVSTTAASGASYKYNRYSGSSVTFKFTGSSVAFVSVRGPTRTSSLNVRLDGRSIRNDIDLRSPATLYRRMAYALNLGTTNATHLIEFWNLGLQGYERLDVDAFVVLYQR